MNAFNLTQWALNHRAVVLFLLILITVAGTLGFGKLGQLEDPNFSVPSMTAMVAWPGATAQQLQDEVLNRMEKKFEQLDHFEKVVTFSRQGFGGMTISVKGGPPRPISRRPGTRRARSSPISSSSCLTASWGPSSTTSSVTSTA